MYYKDQLFIAIAGDKDIYMNPRMLNRHGLITGATGTGKTVTLQTLTEAFSQMGVPVFAADIKGDLSGIARIGGNKESVNKRVEKYGLLSKGFAYQSFPVCFWDVFGEQGVPIRARVSDMGSLLLSRMLSLNETQQAVLSLVFKIASDESLELIDLKDLRKILEYVGSNTKKYTTNYGVMSTASIGAIQRNLVQLEQEGGDRFFGEPHLNITDLMQQVGNKGMVNILAADQLMQSPKLYATLLLWLMNAIYNELPEVGDPDKPKMVFFFDEAHLLFNDAPKALLEMVEKVVRLIRSKGVGIYFVTQNPSDIPDSVLGQLGNRIQHALRAYTPRDQKAVKVAAQTFRANPAFDTEKAITELETGEALVSVLDEKGAPTVVERALILPPEGQIGPIEPEERKQLIDGTLVNRFYAQTIDRESAYELLTEKLQKQEEDKQQEQQAKEDEKVRKQIEKETLARQKAEQKVVEKRTKMVGGILTSIFVPIARKFIDGMINPKKKR